MNSVGIDISKGRSTVAVMRPFGEVVISPFEVHHTDSELSELAKLLKSLDGETRVVMEATGNYHTPVAWLLHDAGLYVSVVNAKLVHGYGNNNLRRVKIDRKDAVKLANYGLDRWLTLPRYIPEEDSRLLLKNCYRQYRQYSKVQTMLKNNLISLLDTTFPNANRFFNSPPRTDGSEKWVDFVADFWHCGCVCESSEKVFMNKYQRWYRKHGYNFSVEKVHNIYSEANEHIGVMPKSDTTKLLVEQAVSQLRATSAAIAALKQEMQTLASQLPEDPIVMEMFGVGPALGPQLMAEIGDVRRFHSKKALVAYAGIDAPPNDSGDVTGRHKGMSKVGASSLRRTLFLVMSVYLQNAPLDEPVYQFMNRKRAEGKPYRANEMPDSDEVSQMIHNRLRPKLEQLMEAIDGITTPLQHRLLAQIIDHIDDLNQRVAVLDEIVKGYMAEYEAAIAAIDEIPGIARRSAEVILAEIGTDMNRFPSAAHLCSWAGVCPGNHQSAGKRKHGKTTKGSKTLKSILTQCAKSARTAKNSHFSAQYQRIAARRGKNRATIAVAHSMLISIYHVLKNNVPFHDLGSNYYDSFNRGWQPDSEILSA